MTKKAFLKLAKKKGFKVKKNHISLAKPLREICGQLKAKYPAPIDELLSCR